MHKTVFALGRSPRKTTQFLRREDIDCKVIYVAKLNNATEPPLPTPTLASKEHLAIIAGSRHKAGFSSIISKHSRILSGVSWCPME